MKTSDAAPECLACGACCFSRLDTYVRVRGDDYARLGDAAETVTTWHGTECFMTMRDGHCGALRIVDASSEFVCTVYEDRPSTCRTLGRGTAECAGERETKYERTRHALRVT